MRIESARAPSSSSIGPIDAAHFALASFAGAALLFAVQPMVGRALLPRLGGAPFVWVICLAFFQLGLFLGYLWVHVAASRLSPRAQLAAQLALVAVALALRPPGLSNPIATDAPPAQALLAYLTLGVGLSYFTLATTTPMLQLVYSRRSGARPYHLYAISNAGSLLGLLSYPFVVEPYLDLDEQANLFVFAFAGYGVLLLAINLAGLRAISVPVAATRAPTAPVRDRLAWFSLSAGPAALMSSISNHITVDVAASPVLWVGALALYLSTFMLAFASPRWHFAEGYGALWIACSVAFPVMLLPGNQVPLPFMLGVPATTLWTGAMLCHGELARRSPDGASLTSFYVWLSAGGAVGGGFVALVAPVVFDGHHELPIAMLAIHAVLAGTSTRKDRRAAPTGAQRLTWIGTGLAVPLLLATLYAQVVGLGQNGRILERSRNFFGPLEVSETETSTVLTHGRTHHGKQLRNPRMRDRPVAYFGPRSGAGRVLRLHRASRARTIGVLGLGVGTLAAYTTPLDSMHFYEINPEVTRLARAHFSFLSGAAGLVEISHGDGRLLLEREQDGRFDILLLDAFSSDSVPTHLLTVEAFAGYLRVLSQGGVLAANVSNRHMAVERVVMGSAKHHGLQTVILESPADRDGGLLRARWALMARDSATLAPLTKPPVEPIDVEHPVVWTDRRSSIWAIAGM